MVVDDELAVCESAAMLQELGMRGSWVLSGAEAVERVVKRTNGVMIFGAVILDWKMPDMDGLRPSALFETRRGQGADHHYFSI
ncbi:MAG: hypothetical protein ACLR2G_10370 [Phascolarctobacterium faecium]